MSDRNNNTEAGKQLHQQKQPETALPQNAEASATPESDRPNTPPSCEVHPAGLTPQARKMEALERFAGAVARDFNNLCMVVSSYSELLAGAVPAGRTPRRYLEAISNATERARGITGEMLAFSRSQSLSPVSLNLNELLVNSMASLRRLAGNEIELRLVQQPSLWAVRVDRDQITRLLRNLVVNARDAMAGLGILTLETRTVTLCPEDATRDDSSMPAAPGDYVRLSVGDTGPGIAPELLERIFEPFFTTKDAITGAGLGLAAVHGIVQQSGGSIFCDSTPGAGATFHIYLPAEKSG